MMVAHLGSGQGVCSHTFKPHKWQRVGTVTTHANGRTIDWMRCKGCGVFWDKDLPPDDA
jgi:hypothetical protein